MNNDDKTNDINGHVYHWVREFLSEWTVQVRVGAVLSSVQTIENGARNGAPQGATISRILFICMVNDFPDSLQGVETSLFADDSAIYKSGRNMAHLQKLVQRSLDRIQTWCGMWGFKISAGKMVAVPFTHSHKTVTLNRSNV